MTLGGFKAGDLVATAMFRGIRTPPA